MASLRATVEASIGSFLYDEGFQTHSQTREAILITIDEIAEYYEEGQLLFPEVLVANNMELIIRLIPHEKVHIGEGPITPEGFHLAIKQCAPLCNDGWRIYINLDGNTMSYGLISAELNSTSLTLLEQLKEQSSQPSEGTCIAYIRRNATQTVEIQGYKTSILVDFSLKHPNTDETNHLAKLCTGIVQDIEQDEANNIKHYLNKILSEALRNGHGNLIGVVSESEAALEAIKQRLTGGVFLRNPIKLHELLIELSEEQSARADFKLRLYASIVKAMLNNDGITIFNTKAQLVGYHLIISSQQAGAGSGTILNNGTGTRSLAFEQMLQSGLFVSGFFKSQDGREKSF